MRLFDHSKNTVSCIHSFITSAGLALVLSYIDWYSNLYVRELHNVSCRLR